MKTFISKSVTSMFQTSTVGNAIIKSNNTTTRLKRGSFRLQLKLMLTRIPVMNTKKIYCQNLYFRLLEYEAAHAQRGKHFDVQIKRPRLLEMKGAFKKLTGTVQRGCKDLSKWRLSTCEDIVRKKSLLRGRILPAALWLISYFFLIKHVCCIRNLFDLR